MPASLETHPFICAAPPAGGPLLLHDPDSGAFLQLGVTSHGPDCLTGNPADAYGFYTDVRLYRDDILAVLQGDDGAPAPGPAGGGPAPAPGSELGDELQYGTEWSDATLAVPEPSSSYGEDLGGSSGMGDASSCLASLAVYENVRQDGGGLGVSGIMAGSSGGDAVFDSVSADTAEQCCMRCERRHRCHAW
jgi:hypothetical protein